MHHFNTFLLRFGNGVAAELVRSADQCQSVWKELSHVYLHQLPNVIDGIKKGSPSYHEPVVQEFIYSWASAMTWPIITMHVDGLRLAIPDALTMPLVKSGRVDSIDFFMMDRAESCCATLGSNDNNKDFGLFINCCAWIELALMPEHFDLFRRQITMVIHHEMAHFIYKQEGVRSEELAHFRILQT